MWALERGNYFVLEHQVLFGVGHCSRGRGAGSFVAQEFCIESLKDEEPFSDALDSW